MNRPHVAVLIDTTIQRRVLDNASWEALRAFADVRRNPHNRPLVAEELAALLADADGAISGWGVGRLDEGVLAGADRLRIVAHSAGSVKPIVSEALWARDIRVTSAAAGIAQDVARTTVALMQIAIKRIWQYARWTRQGGWRDAPFGPADELTGKTVGVIAASHVGRNVIALLPHFAVGRVLLGDPYVSAERAAQLGATKADLDTLMSESDIVTCHAPTTAETRHLINAGNLRLLKNGAIFINTSRGWLVDEVALIAELRTGRIFACLDVTDPEPPSVDSELRRLDNVILTPHISGCVTQCHHLGRMAVEELRRYFAGEPLVHEVTAEMLSRIG
ncbi:MAG: hydroxyacid dehydrogenase [Chloroflexi bacterium]|nr:hydroxyacid dehydrogenase [Chloroflexota bacterium]